MKSKKHSDEDTSPFSFTELFFLSLVLIGFAIVIVIMIINEYFIPSIITLILALIILNLVLANP